MSFGIVCRQYFLTENGRNDFGKTDFTSNLEKAKEAENYNELWKAFSVSPLQS